MSGNEGAAQFAFEASVTQAHIDELGHVNHKVYVAWAEEAAVRHWRAVASLDDQARWIWVASRLTMEFLRESRAGETLRIETRVGAARGARFDRHVAVLGPDGAVRARAVTTWALLDAATRRPARVPPALAALFAPPDLE